MKTNGYVQLLIVQVVEFFDCGIGRLPILACGKNNWCAGRRGRGGPRQGFAVSGAEHKRLRHLRQRALTYYRPIHASPTPIIIFIPQAGIVNPNVLPSANFVFTQILPPIASINSLQMANPIPDPFLSDRPGT